MLDAETKKLLYDACRNNDVTTLRTNLNIPEIDAVLDDQGNTALHIATRQGHPDIICLLLSYHASRTVLNDEAKTPLQMTSDDTIIELYQIPGQPLSDASENRYVADAMEIEPFAWFDSCPDAYRISLENHEHMERLITKVPLEKLLREIDQNYIDKLVFSTEQARTTIKDYLQYAIEENNPLPLAMMFLGTSGFCMQLNTDLAKLGLNLHLLKTLLDYPDDEPPRDMGQYIYTSILVNHTVFRPYRHASTTFRGMNMTPQDLQAYALGKTIINRSFLSTSKSRDIAEMYLGFEDILNRPPVICIYKVTNPRSSLYMKALSFIPDEEDVLIVPFIAFEITAVRDVTMKREGKEYQLKEIELVECGPNPR